MQERLIIVGVWLICAAGCRAEQAKHDAPQGREAAAPVAQKTERAVPAREPAPERLPMDAETAERMEHVADKLHAAGRAEQAAYVEEQLRVHSTHASR